VGSLSIHPKKFTHLRISTITLSKENCLNPKLPSKRKITSRPNSFRIAKKSHIRGVDKIFCPICL